MTVPVRAVPPKLRILVAYPHMSNSLAAAIARAGDAVEFLLDSGAFTAHNSGKPISLDEYCRFLDGLPFRPWRYFMLDVMGHPEATLRNYHAMRARGFNPVPVYTRGAPAEHIQEYAQTADMVALGGLAGREQNRYAYIKAMLPRLQGLDFHVLGMTTPDWLKFVRPYSCDSTTWAGANRYGYITLYMGRGRWSNFYPHGNRATWKVMPAAEAARCRRYGVEPDGLPPKAPEWARLCELSWVEFALEAGERLGTRLFLAGVDEGGLARLLDAQRTVLALREKGAAHAAAA